MTLIAFLLRPDVSDAENYNGNCGLASSDQWSWCQHRYRFFDSSYPDYNREFGRTTPYDFCDLDNTGLMRAARQNEMAKRVLTVNPNWMPFFDGVRFNEDAMMCVSPYHQLVQDLRCPNPSGYSRSEVFRAELMTPGVVFWYRQIFDDSFLAVSRPILQENTK